MKIPDDFVVDADLLRDRVILVTGATGGFGKPLCKKLAAHGATVILLAKNLRLVEQLYDEIEQAGYPTPAIYPMNLEGAAEQDYDELARNLDSQLGRLDGLIRCNSWCAHGVRAKRRRNLVPGTSGQPARPLPADPRLSAVAVARGSRLAGIYD